MKIQNQPVLIALVTILAIPGLFGLSACANQSGDPSNETESSEFSSTDDGSTYYRDGNCYYKNPIEAEDAFNSEPFDADQEAVNYVCRRLGVTEVKYLITDEYEDNDYGISGALTIEAAKPGHANYETFTFSYEQSDETILHNGDHWYRYYMKCSLS